MNTTNFKPNDRVLQIFMRSDGFPIVIKYDVISSDDDSLVLAPIGKASDMTSKIITFTKEQPPLPTVTSTACSPTISRTRRDGTKPD